MVRTKVERETLGNSMPPAACRYIPGNLNQMNGFAEEIIKEILKFVIGVLIAWFLFLTGEALLTLLSCGIHRPRWRGYSGTGALKWIFADAALACIGFTFWLTTFPLAYDFVMKQ